MSNFHSRIFSDEANQKWLAFFFVGLMACLPLSMHFTGIFTGALAAFWIISARFDNKIHYLNQNRFLWPIMLMPFIYAAWLINTSNISQGLNAVNHQLPLLIIPLVIGSIASPSKTAYNIVATFFVLAMLVGSIICTAVRFGYYLPDGKPITDVRQMSIFISHIRFGLMIVFGIAYLIYQAFGQNRLRLWVRVLLCIVALWFMVFLFLLQSVSCWVAMAAIMLYTAIWGKCPLLKKWHRSAIMIFLFTVVCTGLLFITHVWDEQFENRYQNQQLPQFTVFGHEYRHDTIATDCENGHLVYQFICETELREAWNQRSRIAFDSIDAKGQHINSTIIRYITSLGLPKDRMGVRHLSLEDIWQIEQGNANCVYKNRNHIYIKVYELLWELDRFLRYGDANGKSVCMRFEFWHAALHITHKNLWFGVGSGDLMDQMTVTFDEIGSRLLPEFQKPPHNQFLSFLAMFGIVGFTLCMVSMFLPLLMVKNRHPLLPLFVIIILVNMMVEDTLKFQAGVVFYAAVYSALLKVSDHKA